MTIGTPSNAKFYPSGELPEGEAADMTTFDPTVLGPAR